MKKIIAFNLKMAPQSLSQAQTLADLTQTYANKNNNAEIIIFPPFIYLNELINLKTYKLKNLKFGAQNCFWKNSGHYTGEISPKMLKNLGIEYVIIGHSERRQYLNETDEIINKKVLAALKTGLKVILCIGELKRELRIKNKGLRKAKNYVKKQLKKDLKNLSLNPQSLILNSRLIIAYEPIWAIGADHSDTPEDAVEMIKFIKQILNPRFSILNSKVLYGGSIDGKNIKNFVKYKEIDGFLIGHASLNLKEIKNIIKSI